MTEILMQSRDGELAVLTLNRPEKLNAINYALADALLAALDAIEGEADVRAVILAGAGGRAFSAGGDIDEFTHSVRAGERIAVRDFVRRGQALTARIEGYPKPVICAVEGLAYGGGCEIAEASHLTVASADARFAKPEILLGMPPTFGGTQRLARLAGRKRALHLLLTGEPFTAAEALEMGLVNLVVPPGQALAGAKALARRITRNTPGSVAAILTAVTRGLNGSIGEGLQIEMEQFAKLVPTAGLRDRLEAWRGRRAARPDAAAPPPRP